MGTHPLLCKDTCRKHPENTELSACVLMGPQHQWGLFLFLPGAETTAALQVWLQKIQTAMLHNSLRGPKSESCPALALPELLDEHLGLPRSRELQPLQGKRKKGGGWCRWRQPSKLQPHSLWPFSMHALLPTGFLASLHPLPHLCLAWS